MVQWINVFRDNSFVNPTRLPLLCEKTGSLAIVKPGLMAGRQAGSQASRQVGRQAGRQNCCSVRKFEVCIFEF